MAQTTQRPNPRIGSNGNRRMDVGSPVTTPTLEIQATHQFPLGLHLPRPARENEVAQLNTPMLGDPPDEQAARRYEPGVGINIRQAHVAIVQHSQELRNGDRIAHGSMECHS